MSATTDTPLHTDQGGRTTASFEVEPWFGAGEISLSLATVEIDPKGGPPDISSVVVFLDADDVERFIDAIRKAQTP